MSPTTPNERLKPDLQGHNGLEHDVLERILDDYLHVLRAAIARTLPAHLKLESDDVEQEARIRLWKALEKRPEIERIDSYVYRVGVTTAIDAIRKVRARREDSLEADESAPDPQVAPTTWPEAISRRREVVAAVRSCLAGLEERRRRAVGLSLNGLARREIANVLGATESVVRNLVHRGMHDLRACCRQAGIEIPDVF